MYMYVYDGICTYMTYMHVLGSYVHVFSGMTPSDTGTDATSLKITLRGWQSAGHTQGTPGHLGIHLFSRWQRLCRPDLAHPTPRHASWAHEAPLSFRTEVSNARSAAIRALKSSLMACRSRSGRLESIQMPAGVGCAPSKTPPDRNSLMYVYVCICTYIRICMYMYV